MSNKNAGYMTYFHLTLEVGSMRRNLGRINHLQVTQLDDAVMAGGITHSVRFWDGQTYRVLEGTVTEQQEGVKLCLDMGRGKKYHFQKLGS
jgi:hypothetical protein